LIEHAHGDIQVTVRAAVEEAVRLDSFCWRMKSVLNWIVRLVDRWKGMPRKNDERHCVDCGLAAPRTETNYTLISSRHGWRLTIVTDQGGRKSSALRCPACWAKYRQPGRAASDHGQRRKP